LRGNDQHDEYENHSAQNESNEYSRPIDDGADDGLGFSDMSGFRIVV
jgi:hypothetical protein